LKLHFFNNNAQAEQQQPERKKALFGKNAVSRWLNIKTLISTILLSQHIIYDGKKSISLSLALLVYMFPNNIICDPISLLYAFFH